MWYFGGCGGPILCKDISAIHVWGHFHHPNCEAVNVHGDKEYQKVVITYVGRPTVKYEFKFVPIYQT